MKILFFIFCCLYLVYSDIGFHLGNRENSKIYDDSLEMASSSSSKEKKSVEGNFDLSKNSKSIEDDFSLGDEKEVTSSDKSGMSLEDTEDDPFNISTTLAEQIKNTNNMEGLSLVDETLLTTTHSMDRVDITPSTNKGHSNDKATTNNIINNESDILMKTTPENINNNKEDFITTSSSKEIVIKEIPESPDKSDMILDNSNEDSRQNNNTNKTSPDDVQFDIGEEKSNEEDINSKIIIKNNNNLMKNNNIIDTTTAEDITIPFTSNDQLSTTEDPFEVKIINPNDNEENKKISNESNSMEVKQSTIFVGPSITKPTTIPSLIDEDDGEVFTIDRSRKIFSDISSSTPSSINDKNDNILENITTSLILSSTEDSENVSTFPDSRETTILTSTVFVPKISLTTTEQLEGDKSENETLSTNIREEVDFTMTTESPTVNNMSLSIDNTPNNMTEAISAGATKVTLDENLTTQFPESKNMTFDDHIIKSKENVEGSVENEEKKEVVTINWEESQSTTLSTSTSQILTTSIPFTTKQTTTTVSEDIVKKVITQFNNEIEKRKKSNDTISLSNIFPPTHEELKYTIICLAIFLFIFALIVVSVIIIVSCFDIDNFIHMIRIKNNIIGWFLDIYDFIRCKKRKENGMFRFTNSQTSSSICKIEEGSSSMGQTGNYKFNDDSNLNDPSFHKKQNVDLVGFGRLNTMQKVGNNKHN